MPGPNTICACDATTCPMTPTIRTLLPSCRLISTLALGVALLTSPTLLLAQTDRVAPKPVSRAPVGPITLDVDVTDLERKIMEVRQSLPVKPGPMTLYYPPWLPDRKSTRLNSSHSQI